MGPLSGVRIVEFAGIGPGPMCAMLLADLGATVLRIERKEQIDLGLPRPRRYDLLLRNRKAIALDLKRAEDAELALELVDQADGLIEGFRPGTMERLGLGPDRCLARNSRLVYGRMTGWGQSGPLAQAAGHDINYIALTGALAAIGRKDQGPTVPLNLVGDFGGGSLYLALGLLAGIIEAKQSGKGQVVDAAIVEGAASLMTGFYGLHAAGLVDGGRGNNVVDGGAPFYDAYQCADGKWISVGTIEGRFYAELLHRLALVPKEFGPQLERASWGKMRAALASRFLEKTRDEWCALLEGTDACFAPVLDCDEAPLHPHMSARGVFIEIDGVVQPAPAPRFSRTSPDKPVPFSPPSQETNATVLEGWLSPGRVAALRANGAF